jgi:hypothetical protein
MSDIILSTVDLDVFGGPVAVDVSVDFGVAGVRGSRIWAGSGDPDVYLLGQDFKLYDWYINTNTSEDYYSWMYQYVLEVGSPTWVPVLQLNPSQFSTIATTTFTAGSTTISIPIASLTTDAGTVAADYIIRYNISDGTNPVASSFTYSIVSTNIVIVITAAKYSASVWSDLTGSKDVHLFISYKN